LAAARAARPEADHALRLLRAEPEAILQTVERGTGWKRELAIRTAGKLRLEAARPALLRGLANPATHWPALQAFSEIAGPADREAFVEFVRKTPVKQWSYLDFAILGKVGAREAAPLLLEALATPEQRRYAAPVLADLGIREAFDPLCTLIRDNNTNDRDLYDGCAARLATAETVDHLLDAGSTYGLRAATDPAVRRVILDRLRKEERPKERKWHFELLRYSELGKTQAGLEVIEEIARRPADPLAFEASMFLVRRRGAEALALAEEALAKAVDPHWEQVEVLRRYPSDRLVDLMERRGDVGYLEALGTPAAKEALARIAAEGKDFGARHSAAGALAWVGGNAKESLARALAERTANKGYWAPGRFEDLLEADEPGFRDELRRQVKAQGVKPFLSLLTHWSHPEMIPELRKLLVDTPKVKRDKAAAEDLMSGMCGTGRAVDATGWYAVQALGATGDRSLVPFFLELLHEPETRTQHIAIEILGRWKVTEALPALRQLVRSGDSLTRMEAVRALGEIGGPGVADFLKEQIRDTPDDAAHALARLGVDARAEVKAILAESGDDHRLLGALDLMANPKVYAKIDGPLPRRMSRRVADLPELLERLTGTAARLSAGVRKALGEEDHVWYDWKARTLREAFERMGQYGPAIRLAHLFREGAIEICTLDEARGFWARAK
ncbi:MAG TPA: HEAT repeat domain-containing protein, partial [Planctomycetota bacterium]|nr:HEAT repeat domain-containing protein [Planctomycetota bacterium]